MNRQGNNKKIAALVLTMACIGGCGKTVTYTESDLKSIAQTSVSTEQATEQSSEAETQSSAPSNDGKKTAEVSQKTEVITKETVNKEIEDEGTRNSVQSKILENLSKTYDSLRTETQLDFEFIKFKKDDYSSSRYITNLSSTKIKEKDMMYSRSVDDTTLNGVQSLENKITYLIDTGERTLSYSKKFDKTLTTEDNTDWKAFVVDRDLESEQIGLQGILNLLDMSKVKIGEELGDEKEYYTLTCYFPLYQGLRFIGLNTDFIDISADKTAGYNATIKIYASKTDYSVQKIELTANKALTTYYENMYNNNPNSEYTYDLRECKATVRIDEQNTARVDLPSEVKAALPEDAKNMDLGKNVTADDKDSITLDGDFDIGIDTEESLSETQPESETYEAKSESEASNITLGVITK